MKITNNQMLKILQASDTPINKTRTNVVKKGGKLSRSMVLGTQKILYGGGYGESRHNKNFPHLLKTIRAYFKERVKGYSFDAVTINDSHRASRHRDKNNTPYSYIIGLGNYTGGALKFNEGPMKGSHSIKNKMLKFQGEFEHEVTPFKGKRYTLVFYKWKNKK